MRLLVVGRWTETAMRRHIDWALEAGFEVCAADFYTHGARYQPGVFATASLLPGAPEVQHRRFPHLAAEAAQRVAALRLQRLIKQFRPDVVHSYMLTPYTEVCLRAGAQPLVVSVWSQLSALMISPTSPAERRWVRKLRAGATLVLVENPKMETVLAGLPGPALPVQCIPLGVDLTRFHPGYQETAAGWRFVLGIPDGARVVFSPRGWSPIYGQQDILEAFAMACRRIAEPLVLLFLGLGRMKKPLKLAEQVMARSRALGIADKIRWIERVPHAEMPGLYALADVVVNYPVFDTYPSTVLEALACGRPVISSDLPVYRDTFVQMYCRLTPPGAPEALAEALIDGLTIPSVFLQRYMKQETRLEDNLFDEVGNKKKLLVTYYIVNTVKRRM